MESDNNAKPLTEADKAWFAQPVTDIQVEQDNMKWYDALLEMKQDELISYGIYQYNLPQSGVDQMTRQEVISLIVMANKVGGVATVQTSRYRYIKELMNVLSPMVSLRGDRPLYLTRGRGDGTQVYDKTTDTWSSLNKLLGQEPTGIGIDEPPNPRLAPNRPAATTPDPTPPPAPAKTKILLKPKREDLEALATELGIENATDTDKFPSMQTLVDAIELVQNG